MHQLTWKRILAFFTVLALLCANIAFAAAESEEIPDLTLEQLAAMNGGNLVYNTDEDGHITFLQGKFCEEKITDLDSVTRALGGVLLLLGGDENTAFSPAVGMTDDYGNHYYSLYQWSGDMAVENAVVKIITDPEGNAIALSSSLIPGKADQPDTIITPEAALELVKAHLAEKEPDTVYSYEEAVDKAIIQASDEAAGREGMTLVYIIYTNNPNSSVESNDRPYLAHYVARSGKYLYNMPVSSLGSEQAKAGRDPMRVFEGMESAEYTGTVTMSSGATKEITVPVMKDAQGKYYLGDLGRHIVMGDCWTFLNEETVKISSTDDNTGWDNKQLLSYDHYIQAYDYYAAVGWSSTDGLGTPILLLANYVDKDKNPVDNACYMGKLLGWQTFCATSDLNNYCEALDVIGHEYTHGFTTAAMTRIRYENQYGAINESMSDIMGNIMEMLTGSTDDTTWLVGEMTGTPIRSMTDPNRFSQPAYVGDQFFVPDAANPGDNNDRGGVHINNSLLCGVATKLWEDGMTLEEERALWTTFICGLVPGSGYEEVTKILPFAATLAGLDRYQDAIAKALSEIGIENKDPFDKIKEGCGMLELDALEGIDLNDVMLAAMNKSGRQSLTWASAQTGKIQYILPAGEYLLFVKPSAASAPYALAGDQWTNDQALIKPVTIVEGETLMLPSKVEIVEIPAAAEQTEEPAASEAPEAEEAPDKAA